MTYHFNKFEWLLEYWNQSLWPASLSVDNAHNDPERAVGKGSNAAAVSPQLDSSSNTKFAKQLDWTASIEVYCITTEFEH